jgi:hypothetical protein
MMGGGMVRPGETRFMFKRKELNIMKDDERWWKMMKDDERWWKNVIHSGKKRYELAWYGNIHKTSYAWRWGVPVLKFQRSCMVHTRFTAIAYPKTHHISMTL